MNHERNVALNCGLTSSQTVSEEERHVVQTILILCVSQPLPEVQESPHAKDSLLHDSKLDRAALKLNSKPADETLGMG